MIIELKRYMTRCDKCAKLLESNFMRSTQMKKEEMIKILKKDYWQYNLKTGKCLCNMCREDK